MRWENYRGRGATAEATRDPRFSLEPARGARTRGARQSDFIAADGRTFAQARITFSGQLKNRGNAPATIVVRLVAFAGTTLIRESSQTVVVAPGETAAVAVDIVIGLSGDPYGEVAAAAEASQGGVPVGTVRSAVLGSLVAPVVAPPGPKFAIGTYLYYIPNPLGLQGPVIEIQGPITGGPFVGQFFYRLDDAISGPTGVYESYLTDIAPPGASPLPNGTIIGAMYVMGGPPQYGIVQGSRRVINQGWEYLIAGYWVPPGFYVQMPALPKYPPGTCVRVTFTGPTATTRYVLTDGASWLYIAQFADLTITDWSPESHFAPC